MTNDLDAVSSEYNVQGATYLENDLILHWYPSRIINRFGHADSLLELGLGHGFTAGLFAEACDRHVVIEGSPVVIEQFREALPDFRGELVEGYFETYRPEQRFDVIVMGFVLEHVDDPAAILRHYRSLLTPGGKLYVTVPNGKSLNRRLGLELGLIDDLYSLNDNDVALGHQRQYCLDTLKAEVADAGYRVTHVEGIYLKPLPLAVLKTLDDFAENLQAMLRVGVDFPELCVAMLLELEAA